MTILSIARSWRTLVALALLTLCWASPAHAQFETPSRAFHNETSFPLDGRHRDVPCAACHPQQGTYKGTPTRCFDCHWTRRQDDRYRLQLGSQCEQCHRTTAWTDTRWDHAAMTGLSLGAAHRQVTCQSCHTNNTFRAAQTSCVSCHQQDYQNARTPNHVAAAFPTTCEACHRVSDASFNQARFDHNVSFPLVGVHAQQTCATCHKGNVFRGTARDCVGCHRPLYDRTTAPNHVAANFPTTCETCHRPTDPSWRGVNFNHAVVFPLVGLHAQQTCVSCHTNNVFAGTPRDCVGCHRPLYDRTTTPNHAAAGFPTTCENCHRATDPAWMGANFDHNAVFALVGRHAQAVCASCHVNNVFRGTPRECVGCHRAQYERTTMPSHVSAGFPTTCDGCHRPTDSSWQGAGFNHSSVFALVGRHAQTACTSCHVNNVYRGTPRDCIGCHRPQYDRTTAPNHAAAGFPTTCESCHRADAPAWTGAGFNHSSVFALVGQHAQTACASCHVNNVYRGTPRDCVGCHRPLYDRTTAPNHAAAGFPVTCESCHRASDTTWNQGTFNHRFPITSGPHRTTCATCHQGGNYQVFTCLVCHEHDRTRMDDKHRGRAGYRYDSLACYSCHPNGRD
jgi:hypothetical protein